MYNDPRQALNHVKTLMKYSPSDEQLNALHNRVHDWLIEAKQRDENSLETVGQYSAPYTWLLSLVNRVMKKDISSTQAVEEIREYERE